MLVIEDVPDLGGMVVVTARERDDAAPCPGCRMPAAKVRRCRVRTATDLPAGGHAGVGAGTGTVVRTCARDADLTSLQGELMKGIARLPLEDGGAILVEATPEPDGPVRAGRISDAVQELPRSLRELLGPVRETARTVLQELRQAGPEEVEVEFGVDLSAKAGVVITAGEAAVHLKVRVVWRDGGSIPQARDEAPE
ncbi:CU044_2847 family protein [Streptomyces sp. NPDC059168]|uniref:CU044_2847 family protein n=1 Tax=Streptomyces sp. NPDC059168 TaxID=3346753 RepID=UPI0036A69201